MPLTLRWSEVWEAAQAFSERLSAAEHRSGEVGLYGVPRGGVAVALMVGSILGLPVLDRPEAGCLVVDDLVDSGRTAKRYDAFCFDALYRKPWSPAQYAPRAIEVDDWIVFPWEAEEAPAEDAVVRLLQAIGEDPTRDGLVETPARVVRSLGEMTAGYAMDPKAILAKTFEVDYSQMVVVKGIEFTSICEHHLLPFTGTVDVGYLPKHRVVGLSKIPRLVECFALRLQIQERMTQEIADALATELEPEGVAVVVRALHTCMSCRGVRKTAEMVTSAMLGVLMHGPAARAEFLGFVD